MTETITATEVLKSRQNFSDYIEQNADTVIKNLLKDYPPRPLQIIYPQLTQSPDGLIEIVRQLEGNQKAYIFWFIVNEKEDLKNIALKLNLFFDKNYCGIFIIKAVLNEDKIEFEPVLKPELVVKQKREVNTNTPSKQLQKKYWDKYIELCDTSEHPEMQISEALPRHYQYISIGKAGIQILQTINTAKNYVASEIAINNNKSIYEFFFDLKDKIEDEIGELEWYCKDNTKSTKIRKVFEIDVNNPENHEKAILEQVKMGAELKAIIYKYL